MVGQRVSKRTIEELSAELQRIDKGDLCRRKWAILERLFKALLHKLMTGKIRVDELDLPGCRFQTKVR